MKESNKKRSLAAMADFNSVAKPREKSSPVQKEVPDTENNTKDNVKQNTDSSAYINVKISDNKNTNVNTDDMNDLLSGLKSAKKKRLDVYIDADVWQALDDLAKGNGKGTKSEVVNLLLKKAFKLE